MAAPAVAQNTHLALGTTGAPSTPTDISTYCDNVSMPRDTEEQETTAFKNSGNKSFLPGLKGGTISASGNWEPTLDAHIDGIYQAGDSVDFEVGPAGNTAGFVKYTGTAIVTSYSFDAGVGEKIPFSLELRIDSAVTRGTF